MTLFPGADRFEVGKQYVVVGKVLARHGYVMLGSIVTVFTIVTIEEEPIDEFDDVNDYPCIGVIDADGYTHYAPPSALQPLSSKE
jgi:hypothetical protein